MIINFSKHASVLVWLGLSVLTLLVIGNPIRDPNVNGTDDLNLNSGKFLRNVVLIKAANFY